MIIKPVRRNKPGIKDVVFILVSTLILFGVTKAVEGQIQKASIQIESIKAVSAQEIPTLPPCELRIVEGGEK